MSGPLLVRQADISDIVVVSGILLSAAAWLRDSGKPMWRDEALLPHEIEPEVIAGLFYLAEVDGEIAGTLRFQLSDPLIWPDVPEGESAFVHRLAVRRKFSGGAVSGGMLNWAWERAGELGKEFLRLDCDPRRGRLRRVYEGLGFRHHSDYETSEFRYARYERSTWGVRWR